MCLLTYVPPGVMPDLTALRNGVLCNDNGHGFAIVADDRLIVERGMNAQAMIDAFDAARRQHRSGPALFHSRLATHGTTGLDNCHPFAVGGDDRTVLAHNGVLPTEVHPAKGEPRSDTRITAEDFLPRFGSLHTHRNRARLERWMTRHNKMVLLTIDPRFEQQAYILNERSGIWDGGIWYSNDGYLPAATLPWPFGDETWDWRASQLRLETESGLLPRCPFCLAIVGLDADTCHCCGWCLTCGQLPDACGCMPSAELDKRFRPQIPF